MSKFPELDILPNLFFTTAIAKELVNNKIITKEGIIKHLQSMLPEKPQASERLKIIDSEIRHLISTLEKW